jgi:hypothetical protein
MLWLPGEIQNPFQVLMADSGDTPPAGRYARDRTGRYAFTRRHASPSLRLLRIGRCPLGRGTRSACAVFKSPGSSGYRRARTPQAPILCGGFDGSPLARPSTGQESEPAEPLSHQATAISLLCRAVRPERTPASVMPPGSGSWSVSMLHRPKSSWRRSVQRLT